METSPDKNNLEAIAAAVGGVFLALAALWRWAITRTPAGMSPGNKLILEELRDIKKLLHDLEIRITVVETMIGLKKTD